jgi:dolichol-phosphate mannosyltransferase
MIASPDRRIADAPASYAHGLSRPAAPVQGTAPGGEARGDRSGIQPFVEREDCMFLTVVVSVFNEAQSLPAFIEQARRLLDGLGREAEFLFVNDGSRDESAAIVALAAAGDPRLRLLNLSRNFGHEAAMIAGIDHARGAAVLCMDADLQHPLEEIPRMISALDAGNDVVLMARKATEALPLVHRLRSALFYRIVNAISPAGLEPNASDFFLVSGRVVAVLRTEYRERVRFLRSFIQIIGFRRTRLEFVAPRRAHGESRYSARALLELAVGALLGFSNLPLRLGVLFGTVVAGFGLLLGAYSIAMHWLGHPPSGYTTIVAVLCFLFAVQFVITGVIGEYIGHLFTEVKGRPIYVVDDRPPPGVPSAR